MKIIDYIEFAKFKWHCFVYKLNPKLFYLRKIFLQFSILMTQCMHNKSATSLWQVIYLIIYIIIWMSTRCFVVIVLLPILNNTYIRTKTLVNINENPKYLQWFIIAVTLRVNFEYSLQMSLGFDIYLNGRKVYNNHTFFCFCFFLKKKETNSKWIGT